MVKQAVMRHDMRHKELITTYDHRSLTKPIAIDVTDRKTAQKEERPGVKTFPVPFSLEEIQENITINTNQLSQLSKEQIINKAIKLHLQGNVKEAGKYYQYFIRKGFKDHRVFANYGLLLKDLGKLEKAELCQRKAIDIKPNFAEAYYNLGTILLSLGNLKEAELSTRKAIELKPDLSLAQANIGLINLIKAINHGEFNTSKEILLELSNNYPESRNENIEQFFKYWSISLKKLMDEHKLKQLLPIFINLIILGERNPYVRSVTVYIFERFNLKSILDLVGEKDKVLLTLSYCEYKFTKEDFSEIENLSIQNIKKTAKLINKKETEDLGWAVIRRSLVLFKDKGKGRKNLLSLVKEIRK